jgi:hypothetical protein
MNRELEVMWKKAFVTLFKVSFWGGTEGNQEKPQSEGPVK